MPCVCCASENQNGFAQLRTFSTERTEVRYKFYLKGGNGYLYQGGSTKNTTQTQRQSKKKGPAICGETGMKDKAAKTDKAEWKRQKTQGFVNPNDIHEGKGGKGDKVERKNQKNARFRHPALHP